MWIPVREEETKDYVYVYLDTINLHLKTYSKLGSGDVTVIKFEDPEMNRYSGGIQIKFSGGGLEYQLTFCSNLTAFPVSVPTTRDKVWTIQKRGYRIVVFCNGKVVLNITVSSDTCDDPEYSEIWESLYWKRQVDKFYFVPKKSKASLFYYIGTVPISDIIK